MQNDHLPSNWRRVKVEDIRSNDKRSIVSGPFGSNIGKRFFVKEGVPLIRGNNLTLGVKKFVDEGFVYITEEKAYELRNCEAILGDIVFTAAGTLGQVGLIPKKTKYPKYIISNKQLRLRVDANIALSEYLYYWFSSPDMQNHIINRNLGASVPLITLGVLRNLPVNLPPLPTQRKIAAILSAYDDLIENNMRRIAILEEIAQSLYREWFVHFRFPGHEKKSMVESALGMIPGGWEVKAIGEVIETLGGGTPSTQNGEYWDNGDVIWYSPTDLTTAGTMFITDAAKKITELGLYKSSARMFPAYSVMMTSRATIGVIAINVGPACTNQGFITCIPNETLSAYQIYFWLAENKEKIISLASGATFKEINRGTFRKLPVTIADIDTSRQFNELVLPVCKQVENLIAKNANLRQTRDLLLPKLISGEVDVEGLAVAGVEETGEVETKAIEV